MLDLREYRRRPARLADYLPWAALVAPGVVLNKDGSFQRTAEFRGADLDSATDGEVAAVAARLNGAFRRLGSGWALFVEARRDHAQAYPVSVFPDPVSALVDEERKAAFVQTGDHFESRYFLTLTYLPPADRRGRIEGLFIEGRAGAGVDWRAELAGFVDRSDRLLALLDGLAQVCDPGTKVVVIGQTNDIALYRELMRRGVSEYLTQPLGPLQIIRAVSALYADPSAPFVGRQVAFVGAKGGVGASTLAHNFAWSMAEEFRDKGIAFNCLWPRTAIATAAIQNILGGVEGMKQCRKPEIMADAAHAIFSRPARDCTGNFFIDDEVLAAEGVTDFDQYAMSPGTPLMPDFFVPVPGARTVVGKA